MLENTCWSEEQENVLKASESSKISISDAVYPWLVLQGEHFHYKTVQDRQ